MIRVGVVGATGYTGIELVRLLLQHSGVTIDVVTSRGEAGRRLDNLFPSLLGFSDLCFPDPADADYAACDVVFFATPHNVAMREVPALIKQGIRVVDLSADFRLTDVALWERWYGEPHAAPELCAQAVYGLPETTERRSKRRALWRAPVVTPPRFSLDFCRY